MIKERKANQLRFVLINKIMTCHFDFLSVTFAVLNFSSQENYFGLYDINLTLYALVLEAPFHILLLLMLFCSICSNINFLSQ